MSVIGVLIVGLAIITARFAVMHVALLGIAIGLWIGFEPYLLSLILCALTGAGLALLSGRPGGLSGPMRNADLENAGTCLGDVCFLLASWLMMAEGGSGRATST